MQKKHFLFAISILLITQIGCQKKQSTVNKEINSVFFNKITQPAWNSSDWNKKGNVVLNGEEEQSENKLWAFSRWNNDSLWFFFKVEDQCLRAYQTEKDHSKLFLDDMVEILIDTKNDKDSCWAEDDIVYHINLLKNKKDDRGTKECITNPAWNGVAHISVQLYGTLNDTTDLDTGYIVSLVFPWKELEQSPKPGLMMGINFANGDNDGKGRQLFDWAGAWPMRSPYAFGNLILVKK
jgi:hypothetical protein